MLKIGLLCSGQLGQESLDQIHSANQINGRRSIEFVMTDRRSTGVIEFCNGNSIPVFTGNPRKGRTQSFLQSKPADVIASINYLFLVERDVIDHAKQLAFNVHGSLLPKYRGRTPHVWAIINGESEVGITAHKMVVECDAGDVIEQVVIPLNGNETGADVLTEYGRQYYPLIDRVLHAVQVDAVRFYAQDESKATSFGKRTAEDGEINWNWSRERIRNWIRAQAAPYPGAFTWLGGSKIIIDRASFSEHGFDSQVSNGTLLEGGAMPIVKTPNGALRLDCIRDSICNKEQTFETGLMFGQAS